MKRKISELSEKERITTLDALYTAAGSLKGREAMKLFLRDLLTESERIMLGRRILIARLLLTGATRRDIGKRMRVRPKKKIPRSYFCWLHRRYSTPQWPCWKGPPGGDMALPCRRA